MTKKGEQRETQVFVWDVTIWLTGDDAELQEQEVIDQFNIHAKKWVFQREEGSDSNGKQHFQCRLSLNEKKRKSEIIALFEGKPWHFTQTSTANKGNMFYAMKTETRVDGPWKNTTHKSQECPWQLAGIKENMRPFQATIYSWRLIRDSRAIDLIWDKNGDSGKSSFATRLDFEGEAYQLTPSKNTNEMCADLCDELQEAEDYNPKMVFVDMERAADQEHTGPIFAALERIKGGRVVDRRYKLRKIFFGSPRIVVFMNRLPNLAFLSSDRWRVWRLENHELHAMSQDEQRQVYAQQESERNVVDEED